MRLGLVTLALLVGCVNLTRPEDLRDWTTGAGDARMTTPDVSPVDGARPDNASTEVPPAAVDAGTMDTVSGDSTGADASKPDIALTPDVATADTSATPDVTVVADAPLPADVMPDTATVPGNGPALHWRFDEANGTTALDSSGHGYNGLYQGLAGSVPAASTNVPPVQFSDPASRSFTSSQRHQVRLSPIPAALKPANSVTVSLWFRTRTVDSSGYSLLFDVAGGYFLTLGSDNNIWQARDSGGPSLQYCSGSAVSQTDGQWHHIAGVWSPTGMKLYYDGNERCSNSRGGDMVFDGSDNVFVGRRSSGSILPFEGHIDDVRVYTRVLTAAEIQKLAGGSD